MTYRVRNIAVAVGLALVAALLTTFYVANYKRHVQQSESTVTVYVAKRDIPQGTPGADLIRHGWIGTENIAQRTVVPGAISNSDQVRNLITTQNIYAGEQVSLRRFAGHAEQGVRAQLHGTLRAVSIPGTPDALLTGTLRDGDHVDLVANLKEGTSNGTRVVARNILVLRAAVLSAGAKVGAAGSGTSVLLAVNDSKEEQKIWYTVENAAGWSLALRPVANAVDSPDDLETGTSVAKDGLSVHGLQNYVNGGGR
jgi:Flp pilus assembly protein CpaB